MVSTRLAATLFVTQQAIPKLWTPQLPWRQLGHFRGGLRGLGWVAGDQGLGGASFQQDSAGSHRPAAELAGTSWPHVLPRPAGQATSPTSPSGREKQHAHGKGSWFSAFPLETPIIF